MSDLKQSLGSTGPALGYTSTCLLADKAFSEAIADAGLSKLIT
jgi:hypothetical protein